MRYFGLVLSFLQMCIFVQSEDPPGHMQPLGSHMPPIEVEVRDTVPDPIEFFNDYIKPGKPVVFKGAAKELKNYETWKDDEYLKEKYGKWMTQVEVGKYEGRIYGRFIFVSFKHFINTYKKRQYYIITDIVPDNPMREDITLTRAMACGGYAEQSLDAVLLFSSGSTQSALHWDAVDNMHCLLDGTKEWIMFDQALRGKLPLLDGFHDYSEVDCRKVDMYKYPIFQELPWHHASLEKGDCMFIPDNWPHNVRSPGNKRNMAQAMWFGPIHHLNTSDCPEDLTTLPNTVPLGKRRMTREDNIRNALFHQLGSATKISKQQLLETADDMNETAQLRAYYALDKDRDGYVTYDEIENLNEEFALFSEAVVFREADDYIEKEEPHDEL